MDWNASANLAAVITGVFGPFDTHEAQTLLKRSNGGRGLRGLRSRSWGQPKRDDVPSLALESERPVVQERRPSLGRTVL